MYTLNYKIYIFSGMYPDILIYILISWFRYIFKSDMYFYF